MAVNRWLAFSIVVLASMLCQRTAAAQTDDLRRYIACDFGGKLSVEESIESPKGFERSVSTRHGSKKVAVLHGFSLHIAYAGTPFVNFKVERLARFDSTKQILIDQMAKMAEGTKDIESKTPQQISFNGFDIFVIDREKLSGGVQSVYMLFRDADQTVVTLYILNTPPEAPQFSTIEQYRAMSGAFVGNYTACVDKNLK